MTDYDRWLHQYCCRNTEWTWRTAGCANVLAADGSVRFELDEWQTMVFFHADCGPTVQQLVRDLSKRSSSSAGQEKNFELKILAILYNLATELNVIDLIDRATSLPYHYDIPVAEQDAAEAMRSKQESSADH